jgi:hypothetical protein
LMYVFELSPCRQRICGDGFCSRKTCRDRAESIGFRPKPMPDKDFGAGADFAVAEVDCGI